MEQTAILPPFFGTMLLTLAVWTFMFCLRIPFLLRTNPPRHLLTSTGLASLAPPGITASSDNLKNLLELPVLFYALVLYLMVMDQVDAAHIASAWIFFLFRLLHSAVHCAFGHVALRFGLYMVAAAALWFMIIRASVILIVR